RTRIPTVNCGGGNACAFQGGRFSLKQSPDMGLGVVEPKPTQSGRQPSGFSRRRFGCENHILNLSRVACRQGPNEACKYLTGGISREDFIADFKSFIARNSHTVEVSLDSLIKPLKVTQRNLRTTY